MKDRLVIKTRLLLTSILCASAVLLVLGTGSAARAAPAADDVQEYIVVKGVRVPVKNTAPVKIPLKSAYTVSILGQREIDQASPVTTAQQLLAREPSIYVTNNGPGGVNQNITYRSFNDGQFSETFDGIGLNDAFNAGVTAQADNDNNTLITTNDFQAIQLYRGINNPSVNSYNSLGGTINYVPRAPSDTFGGEAGISYGSFNTLDWRTTVNTGLVDGVKQIASFDRLTSDGWTRQDKNSVSNLYYGLDAPLNGGNTDVYATFIFDQDAGLVNQLEPVALLHQFGDTYQLPSSDYNKQNTSTNFSFIGGVTQKITPDLSVDLKGFFGGTDYVRGSFCNEDYASTALYYVNDCNTAPYHRYGYATRDIGVQPSAKLVLPFNTLEVGGNLTVAHLHSSEFFSDTAPVLLQPNPQGTGNDFWDEHDYRTLGSVWAQDEISLLDDRLKITPGVKYLWAETKDTDNAAYYYPYTGSVSNYAHYLSPTAGISYEILTGLDAYAAYGQNLKFPDITSYYNNISTNSGSVEPVHVQPEYVHDYEAGLRFQRDGLSVEANYYREDFLHTFVTTTDPATGNSTTSNGGGSRYEGEELQIGDDFGALVGTAVPGDFAGYVNFAHNTAVYTSSFTDQFSGQVVRSGQQVGNVPLYLVSFGASWTDQGHSIAVNSRYVGSQMLNNANVNLPAGVNQGGYVVTDLSFADRVPVHAGFVKALKLTLSFNNIFGVRYYNQSDINLTNTGLSYREAIIGAPRAVYGGIAAEF